MDRDSERDEIFFELFYFFLNGMRYIDYSRHNIMKLTTLITLTTTTTDKTQSLYHHINITLLKPNQYPSHI
jgi:hypothetical protein